MKVTLDIESVLMVISLFTHIDWRWACDNLLCVPYSCLHRPFIIKFSLSANFAPSSLGQPVVSNRDVAFIATIMTDAKFDSNFGQECKIFYQIDHKFYLNKNI